MTRRPGAPAPPRRGVDLRPLAVVAAAVSVLAVGGALPVWAGLAHHVALPPLDLAADVRVLLAEAPSYPAFAAGLAVAVAARAVVLAAVLGALDRAGLRRGLAFYGVALVPALAAGVLGFSGVAAVYALFLWAGAALALTTALALGPVPWAGRGGDGRPVVLAYLGGLLVVSLASTLAGAALQVALVWASAGLTALTVRRLATPASPGSRPRRWRRWRRRPGVALVLPLALTVTAPRAGLPAAPAGPAAGTLLLVPGNGGSSGTSTMFLLDPAALGYRCDQTAYFSYAGRGDGAPRRDARCPITRGAPYAAADTRRPPADLVAAFRAQIADLPPPVVVVAHSQGGWIAAAALTGDLADRVEAVVLLGAFPRHERGYVLDGTGGGVAGTDGLEAVTAVLRGLDATTFAPRAPMARAHLGRPGGVASLMVDGFPARARVATVTSAFDLPAMGPDWRLPGATDLCPVYVHHGSLPTADRVHQQVRGFLTGEPAPSCGWWRRWPTQAFTPFGAPGP